MIEADDLAARAAAGDSDAFDQLMQGTKAGLYRFVRRYAGDGEEAYDLVQEAYAAAWLSIRRYDPRRPFEAWLRTIALNKCRDWSRRRRVRYWLLGAADLAGSEALAVTDEALGAADQYELGQRLGRLEAAIADLPAQLKAPLLLTALEERSQAEAAAILGISVKAVETRVARARRKLAEVLGPAAGVI